MKFSTPAYVVLVIFSAFTAGCSTVANYEPKPDIQAVKAESLITSTASMKSEYVLRRGSDLIICTPPAPDATFAQGKKGGVTISLLNFGSDNSDAGGSVDEEKSSGEEMTGRVPHVLLGRDLLFRLCEFVRNNNVEKDAAIKLYEKNLEIISAIANRMAERTNITISNSISERDRTSIGNRMRLPSTIGSINSVVPSYSGQIPAGANAYPNSGGYPGTGGYPSYPAYPGTGAYPTYPGTGSYPAYPGTNSYPAQNSYPAPGAYPGSGAPPLGNGIVAPTSPPASQ